MSTFDEALVAMKNGNKVKRQSVGFEIQIIEGEDPYFGTEYMELQFKPVMIQHADLLADDWVILD